MSRRSTALPADPIDVELSVQGELEGMQVRFPMQDVRYDSSRDLPALVLVRSKDSGRGEIAGTGWWGNLNTNPELVAVRASPVLVGAMAGGVKSRHTPAKIRRARWWDVLIFAHGFLVPTFVALLVAGATIAGAVLSFRSGSVLLGIPLLVLVAGAAAELAKAATDIAKAAHTR